MTNEQGLIHIYCGDGKGKTSAAFGLSLRCAGYGEKVLVLQFLKGWDTGELRAVTQIPEIHVLRGNASSKFAFQMDADEKTTVKEQHNSILQEASSLLSTGYYRMLILDEVMDAWALDLIDQTGVLQLLQSRPANVEVVMTGHQIPDALRELADYISEVHKVRHPYDSGVLARRCIEY